jgi:hypothetical protein
MNSLPTSARSLFADGESLNNLYVAGRLGPVELKRIAEMGCYQCQLIILSITEKA